MLLTLLKKLFKPSQKIPIAYPKRNKPSDVFADLNILNRYIFENIDDKFLSHISIHQRMTRYINVNHDSIQLLKDDVYFIIENYKQDKWFSSLPNANVKFNKCLLDDYLTWPANTMLKNVPIETVSAINTLKLAAANLEIFLMESENLDRAIQQCRSLIDEIIIVFDCVIEVYNESVN